MVSLDLPSEKQNFKEEKENTDKCDHKRKYHPHLFPGKGVGLTGFYFFDRICAHEGLFIFRDKEKIDHRLPCKRD
jgi:uncharacterized membrane protein YcgQ (UPF0703/DUF1980 family)